MDLQQLEKALTILRELDADMTMSPALGLLAIAKYEGLSVSELASMIGMGIASASRYVGLFSTRGPHNPRGLGLITTEVNPEELRKKSIFLSPKGRSVIEQLKAI